jgi:hypothetical protein
LKFDSRCSWVVGPLAAFWPNSANLSRAAHYACFAFIVVAGGAVSRALSRPVNFMIAIRGRSFSVAELAGAGVKRVSLATSLYRAAMTGLLAAAREIHDHGTCNYLEDTLPRRTCIAWGVGGSPAGARRGRVWEPVAGSHLDRLMADGSG